MSILQLEIDGEKHHLELARDRTDSRWTALVDGKQLEVDARLVRPGVLSLIVHGHSFQCVLDEGSVETAIVLGNRRYIVTINDPRSLMARRRKARAAGGTQMIKAPMPGRILRLLASVGDHVEAHQPILVIEAMKMQNEVRTSQAGRLAHIAIEAGATVTAGATLATIEADDHKAASGN
jgi:biotin carboxyl carrier protein